MEARFCGANLQEHEKVERGQGITREQEERANN